MASPLAFVPSIPPRRGIPAAVFLTILYGSRLLMAASGVHDAAMTATPALTARAQPWQRRAEPILSASTTKQPWCRVVLYSPHVIRHEGKYLMWYGGHVAGGIFELFCAESTDGSKWITQHERPAFPASRDKTRFDGRYTSTPCVIEEADRYLMYYSARDWKSDYVTPDGKKGRDGAGVYAHVGVAVCPKGRPGDQVQ